MRARYIPLRDTSRGELSYGVKCVSRINGDPIGTCIYWFSRPETVALFISGRWPVDTDAEALVREVLP